MNTMDLRAMMRSKGRAARAQLRGSDRAAGETQLCQHLQSLDALFADSVGVFVAHDGEPDLMPLIDWLWSTERTVSLPTLNDDPDDYSMRFVPWHQRDALEKGRYGIPVPPNRPAIEPATLLVSFVGFDRFGNRIGRGGGFFDRYLADRYVATSDAAVIGVGFEAQRFDQVPVEPHDVPLPIVATDAGVRFIRSQ